MRPTHNHQVCRDEEGPYYTDKSYYTSLRYAEKKEVVHELREQVKAEARELNQLAHQTYEARKADAYKR